MSLKLAWRTLLLPLLLLLVLVLVLVLVLEGRTTGP